MGVLIGCGYFGINVTLTNHEPELINKIEDLNNYKFDKSSKVHEYIKQTFGLCTSTERFIPQEYLLFHYEHIRKPKSFFLHHLIPETAHA